VLFRSGQILNIFIPSASGLGLLLMLTMYPILVSLGVSKAGATAMIATASCLDLGPGSGNATLAAKNAGMDVAVYFTNYQIPVAIGVMAVVAISHMFVQQYFDKKEDHIAQRVELESAGDSADDPSKIYALLPIFPLFLILVCGDLFIKGIKMDVITAMLISIIVSMIFEYLRKRNFREVLKSMQIFFDGMGTQFAAVVTLIIAGEVFAKGLMSIGAIDTIIKGAQNAGFGSFGMTLVMTGVIVVASIVMGSGNAPFFAFAALAPTVAAKMEIASVLMLLPMQFAAGIARNVSPITAVVVAVSGISNVPPIEIAKRSAIPMGLGLIATIIGTFTLLH
jgi:DcuC family C4-dicarboxylate transporter